MYSREELLAEVHRLADGDEPPTTKDLKEKGHICQDPYYRVFENWPAVLRAAGYDPHQGYDISRDALLAEIHRLADGNDPPEVAEINTNGKYSERPYYDEFGSYNAAVREAGYKPDRERNIDDGTLLKELSAQADGKIAPSEEDFDGKYSAVTYRRRFGSWKRAAVMAGLKPQSQRPLTTTEFRQFFQATTNELHPRDQLIGRLMQFTGLTTSLITSFSESWLMNRTGDTLVVVPKNMTKSGERWVFRLPETWNDNGTQRKTGLPGLLNWYFETQSSIVECKSACHSAVHRIAASAGLTNREHIQIERIGTVPRVHPQDLRATGGVRMARNGAPPQRIRRHLGIEHTEWDATIDDFFIWCDVHNDDFVHPEYNRPNYLRDSG